jgi:hypothetical protein
MRSVLFVLAAILALAGALRCVGLGAKNLWLDESLSWRMLEFPVTEVIERTGDRATANPPLYFLVLRGWAAVFGESEFALRSLSVFFGLATVAGVYALVRALSRLPSAGEAGTQVLNGRGAALLAAALVAVSPFAVYVSQQARAYSMGTALFVWGSWSLIRALTAVGSGAGFWILYGVLALASCYVHYLTLFLLAAQGAFVVIFLYVRWESTPGVSPAQDGSSPPTSMPPPPVGTGETATASRAVTARGPRFRTQLLWAVAVFVAVGLGYLPWLSRLLEQSDRMADYSWHPPFELQQLADGTSTALCATVAAREPLEPLAGWAVTLMLVGLVVNLARRLGWSGRFLALLALVPVALLLAYSLWSGRSLMHARYMAFVVPVWLTALAVSCCLLPRSALLAAAVALLGWQSWACYANWEVLGPTSSAGMRTCCASVVRQRDRTEPIAVESPFLLLPALYYSRSEARPVVVTDRPSRKIQHQAAQLRPEDLVTPEQFLAQRPTGIWCISSTSYGRQAGLWFPLPAGWHLDKVEVFEQDNPWEEPLIVEHYVWRPQSSSP